MKNAIVAAMAAACVGGAVGLAAPASADGPIFKGTFLLTTQDGSTNTWVVTPCGAGCARVVSDTRLDADAHLADGQWHFTYTHPTGWDCEDGTDAPATRRVAVDAATLQGTVAQGPDNVCGETDVVDDPFTFTLNQIG
ncbi:hypothetical protein [Mycobacterium sp. 236(2023)]|uniref:hypothetical protein n=1 Tax=Mycobacterium sp. 236(2023) TaxID=3038163 RepID=UPI00241581A7|nr:hypothetical protein [Mycobacterium sp. 236(2023)]MDG4667187.1 hypothetical protein [Mycobacterium sp. 236(2023)]